MGKCVKFVNGECVSVLKYGITHGVNGTFAIWNRSGIPTRDPKNVKRLVKEIFASSKYGNIVKDQSKEKATKPGYLPS